MFDEESRRSRRFFASVYGLRKSPADETASVAWSIGEECDPSHCGFDQRIDQRLWRNDVAQTQRGQDLANVPA